MLWRVEEDGDPGATADRCDLLICAEARNLQPPICADAPGRRTRRDLLPCAGARILRMPRTLPW